ncbi:DNA recombination protein RmuC [Nocardia sp. NBC_00416]|uniref:DNA recombination protein RmuC n=1 Tax=Nocardia sp. NBC_00416 TaxID=2975991 RepID=UPI002E245518
MTTTVSIVTALVGAVLFAAVGYLIAGARHGRRRAENETARTLAEEQSRAAGRRADDLRAERNRATERAERLERENATMTAGRQGLDEQLGQLRSELSSTRAELHRAEGEVERLRAELASAGPAADETRRALRDSEQRATALHAVEEQLRVRIQEMDNELTALRTEIRSLREDSTTQQALRKQIEEMSEQNLQMQKEAFEALGNQLLTRSQETLVSAAESKLAAISKPVHEGLAQMGRQLKDFEVSRTSIESRLQQEIKGLAEESVRNRMQTSTLVQALKRPQTRGQWGEMQLKRAVELAGMVEHCDFDLQVTVVGEESAQRPDMVIRMAGGKDAIVDSKVPMEAFVAATEAADEDEAQRLWIEHGKQLRKHVDALSGKGYHAKFERSPEFVILFVPSESFLAPALEHHRDLLEHAAAKQVLIATPVTLIAALRAIAFGWKQEALHANMREIQELGTLIYNRLATMGKHLETLGTALDSSVKAYNDAVGSMESRVLVTARKFQDLKLVEKDLPELRQSDRLTRSFRSPELIESAATDHMQN